MQVPDELIKSPIKVSGRFHATNHQIGFRKVQWNQLVSSMKVQWQFLASFMDVTYYMVSYLCTRFQKKYHMKVPSKYYLILLEES